MELGNYNGNNDYLMIGPDPNLNVSKCHPWWLVAGSIPAMTSYGHGHRKGLGNSNIKM